MGLRPLRQRRLAAWVAGISEVAALEEAYRACTREEGKPTIEQRLAIRDVEALYIEREGIEIVPDEEGPVLTPTDPGFAGPEAAMMTEGDAG